jgi:hypothetical protein
MSPKLVYSVQTGQPAFDEDSRLLIIEMVLPEESAFHPGKMLSMTILALTSGRERMEREHRALLEKANFWLTRVIPASSNVSIVEAVHA